MQRLLLADATGTYGKSIKKQLQNEFLIESCDNGERALELIREFDPDILFLDLQLPCVDGLAILRTIRAASLNIKVIILTPLTDEYIIHELTVQKVSGIFLYSCTLGSVINCIRDISKQLHDLSDDEWIVENEVDRILLDLGFKIGPARYSITRAAVLYWYDNPNCFLTKCLYPALAKRFGGTKEKVDKAIRDAVKDGWDSGSRQMWYLYFPPRENNDKQAKDVRERKHEQPSNEVFLHRIATALKHKTRLKKPWEASEKIAR